jgi:methyl-accepting chemotaxis protein
MQVGLRELVSTVRLGVDSVAVASSEIASGNLDLSTRTEQQSSSLQATVSAIHEMATNIRQNTDSANQANDLARSASEIAVRGGGAVQEVMVTMDEISAASRKIVDIIGVIDGIAFQTNILALNAAVEAARAGEQGRGFAVVATEVRALAGRSAAAAKEIKSLITASIEQVDAGNRVAAEAGATMTEIVANAEKIAGLMSDIGNATREQSTGVGQVGQAVHELDRATQQNAALVEQTSAAAGSLSEQAQRLAEEVGFFKLR